MSGNVATNPIKIMDTTMRDGHQSLFATRMRTEDMEPIAAEINKVGFHAAEVWGGATFDSTTRFLNEDPWERVRVLKKLMPDTPLQMLLRGQNLVGYRNYADDVVDAFVDHTAEVGIDIFRVFDALNDERNCKASYEAIKKTGKHIQATLSFSLTERRLGGPVYNIDYFVNKAKIFEDMGAHSLCLKDMAGMLSPYDAYELIQALKANVKIPIELHNHYTSGMGSMTCLKAIEAGVDIIDCALAPFALRTSQPACEPIVAALKGTPRDSGLDLDRLLKLGKYFEEIGPKYRKYLDTSKLSVIDTGVLSHQIPGGMASNLVNQLREADALDRIGEVHEELPRARKELGYPPLVTPTSQIVGIQAVQNVLFGRYKMVTGQVKDYAYGMYGKSPAPMDPDVQKQILAGYERGEEPITHRPADILEPEMGKAKEATEGIAKDIGDVLCYAMYPQTGLRFLKWKYGLEEVPDDVKPITLESIQKQDALIKKVLAGEITSAGAATAEAEAPAEAAKVTVGDGEVGVAAPMPGTIFKYTVEEGDTVKAGDTVVVLEAMKMENAIPALSGGKIKTLVNKTGTIVKKNDLLVVITTA